MRLELLLERGGAQLVAVLDEVLDVQVGEEEVAEFVKRDDVVVRLPTASQRRVAQETTIQTTCA